MSGVTAAVHATVTETGIGWDGHQDEDVLMIGRRDRVVGGRRLAHVERRGIGYPRGSFEDGVEVGLPVLGEEQGVMCQFGQLTAHAEVGQHRTRPPDVARSQ